MLTSEVSSGDVAVEEAPTTPKTGWRVRVMALPRVYHVLKAPDLNIQSMVGVVNVTDRGIKTLN